LCTFGLEIILTFGSESTEAEILPPLVSGEVIKENGFPINGAVLNRYLAL
jgi:hypothetical protein